MSVDLETYFPGKEFLLALFTLMQTVNLKPDSYDFWSHNVSRETYSVNRAVSDPIKGTLMKFRLSVYYKLPNRFSIGTPLREIHFPIRFSLRSLCLNLRLLLYSCNVLRINHPILFAWMSGDCKNTWPKVWDHLTITSTRCICFHIDLAFSYWSKTCWCSPQWEMWGPKVGIVCNSRRLCCIMIIFCRFFSGIRITPMICCSTNLWKLVPYKNSHRLITECASLSFLTLLRFFFIGIKFSRSGNSEKDSNIHVKYLKIATGLPFARFLTPFGFWDGRSKILSIFLFLLL